MSVFIFYLFSALILSYYLSGTQFQSIKGFNSLVPDYNLGVIEFLTQYKVLSKKYGNPPEKYEDYNCFVRARIVDDIAMLNYDFPILGRSIASLHLNLYPYHVSAQVDSFGMPMRYIDVSKVGFSLKPGFRLQELLKNSRGWTINNSVTEVSYSFLVNQFDTLSAKVAYDIYCHLLRLESDSYDNRVQAVLNFVQFLPYGIPNFDTDDWYYHELSLPPESFVLSYGDCDSKSLLFASIMKHLIPKRNIIIIVCKVKAFGDMDYTAHAMIGVSGLSFSGESVSINNVNFLILETTAPSHIGEKSWEKIIVVSVHELQ